MCIRDSLTAASLDVFARLRNDVDTISVAGSDPIARRDKAMQAVPTLGNAGNAAALKAQAEAANAGTNTKGISADASVALAIVESNVQALADAGATVKTTNEEDTIETVSYTHLNSPSNPSRTTYSPPVWMARYPLPSPFRATASSPTCWSRRPGTRRKTASSSRI